MNDEALGESTGLPGQRLRLAHAPVVGDVPPLHLQVADYAGEEGWTDWEAVPHFAASGPHDRHLTLDAATGEIVFGPAVREPDGSLRQYGAVPPKGAVIRAVRYRTGGGRDGNVARGTVRVLRNSIPYVADVVNREAARGGVDGETVEEAKAPRPDHPARPGPRRDPAGLRGTRPPGRARDRPHRLPGGRAGSEYGPTRYGSSSSPRPSPTRAGGSASSSSSPATRCSARITRYLDERRLIGTRLAVGPPFYQGVTVVATVHSFRGVDTDRCAAGARRPLPPPRPAHRWRRRQRLALRAPARGR